MHTRFRSTLTTALILTTGLGAAHPTAAQTTTTTFVSGPSWNTTDASGSSLGGAQYVVLNSQYPTVQPPGATNYGASAANPGWTANLSSIPGAYWIWAPGITGTTSNASLAQYSFSQQFFLAGAPQSGIISVAVDDLATVFVNGTLAGSTGSISDEAAAFQAQSALATFNIAPYLTTGQNTITINAENGPAYYAGSDPNPPYSVNTAGVVFGGSITSAAAPVPEASTTVSFGLLLVLGGAAAFAAKRKSSQRQTSAAAQSARRQMPAGFLVRSVKNGYNVITGDTRWQTQ